MMDRSDETSSPCITSSLCPHCLRRVASLRVTENDNVYLVKSCPEHGNVENVLLWNNRVVPYDNWSRRNVPATADGCHDGGGVGNQPGCPFECGICPGHQQKSCSVILEVTGACNLNCPVCFASSHAESERDPDIDEIVGMLRAARDRAGCCPLQLSGGEPTMRDDLPRLVALAKELGFDHVQVNTNGVRLALDREYGHALKEAGVTDFFLQFDGVTDEIYRRIRGAELLEIKRRAVERCAELELAVILVPTLVRGVNDSQIGAIVRFAKEWMPTVKGVHFQPVTFIGRYPGVPRNEDRILLPDILAGIEAQTGGEMKVDNFLPPG
jgi:7,8-dihydro-6-hydroxymethylpterin dimethyltransferase